MGGVFGRVGYDFKSARARIQELTLMYRRGRRLHPDDPEWGWELIAQIEELEQEITEAHKANMAAVQGDHIRKNKNTIVFPIVS